MKNRIASHDCKKSIEDQYWALRENDLFTGVDSPRECDSPMTLMLKASLLAEKIIQRVRELRSVLPQETYRGFTNRLASLERDEQANDYFSDPSNDPAYTDEERENAESVIGF